MLGPQVLELIMLEAANKKKEAVRMARIFGAVAAVFLIIFLLVYALGIVSGLTAGPGAALFFLQIDLFVALLLIALVWIATGTMDFLQEILPESLKDEIKTLKVVSMAATTLGMILVPLWFISVWDARQAPGKFLMLMTTFFLLSFLSGLYLLPKGKGGK
jgi:hypothetical protein